MLSQIVSIIYSNLSIEAINAKIQFPPNQPATNIRKFKFFRWLGKKTFFFLGKFSFLHSLLQWLLGGGLLLDGTGWWSATVTDPFPLHFSVFFFFLPFLSDIMSISLWSLQIQIHCWKHIVFFDFVTIRRIIWSDMSFPIRSFERCYLHPGWH